MTNRIHLTGQTEPRIDPAVLASAMGAEGVGDAGRAPHPFARFVIGSERSRRQYADHTLTVAASEWAQLESLAAALADGHIAPSPEQIGTVLLNLALRSTESAPLLESLRREFGASGAVAQAG